MMPMYKVKPSFTPLVSLALSLPFPLMDYLLGDQGSWSATRCPSIVLPLVAALRLAAKIAED